MASCLALVIAFSLGGCIRNDHPEPVPVSGIRIEPVIAQGRITGNAFDPGDRIGLYVASSPGAPAAGNYAANVPYTFDGVRWTAPGGSPLPWPGTGKLDLYAYWPYDPDLSAGDPRAYGFAIRPDQRTAEDYLSNDLLWARATGAEPGEDIPLAFYHRMARLQVNIRSTFEAGSNWPDGAEIAITGLSHEMTIDLVDGSITPRGTGAPPTGISVDPKPRALSVAVTAAHEPVARAENDVLPLVLPTPAAGYDITLAAIVMPQEIEAGRPLVRITLDGNEYAFIPGDAFSLIPGENLTLNLTLTDQPPGLVFDLDQLDWNVSRVWNVYDGTTIVAQVCREYLQGTSAPDVQAVVAYLASTAGADFSTGLAARVFVRAKNGSGGYDIDLQSVHGGSVNFSASTLYQAGTFAPIRKVAVDPGVGLFAAEDQVQTNLTVRPATVSDYDGNAYPVVKINRWYWTASNLKATHYRNGNTFTAWPYGGNAANTPIYGLLYSGYTAYDPQGLLPTPWQLPYEEDYEAMYTYLQPLAGSKIKSNTGWSSVELSDDVSGFSLLPGGFRDSRGVFSQLGTTAWWWTETYNGFEGTHYSVGSADTGITGDMSSHDLAMSVRFVLKNPGTLTRITP